ncbi:hypothetical protein OH76DRAFT_1487355 [Lentinus brumalis]|uniref:Uncharacterized protein n=1 Tax=Lentinus brumalis TaxID=2498619 RepID=A0A371CV36_9APHY|nr:hypothetical protein OH76DRAFT_1487355 [Polyporus brumalis]
MARQEGQGSAGQGGGALKRRYGAGKDSPLDGRASCERSPSPDQTTPPGPVVKKVRFDVGPPSSPASLEICFDIDDILPPSTPGNDLIPALVDHHASPPPSEVASGRYSSAQDAVPEDPVLEKLWTAVLNNFSPPTPERSPLVPTTPTAEQLWVTVLNTFSPPTPESSASGALPYASSPMIVSDYPDSSPTPAARGNATSSRSQMPESAPTASLPSPTITLTGEAWASFLEVSPCGFPLPDLEIPPLVDAFKEPAAAATATTTTAAAATATAATAMATMATIENAGGRAVLPIMQLSPPHWGAYNEMLAIRASQLFHVVPDLVWR